MAGGGAVQLTLHGVQDKYLHIEATSGFFDSQHITYEDFAIESIAVDSQGAMDFGRGAKFKFTGAAEMAAGAYLETVLPELTAKTDTVTKKYYIAWVHSIGLYLFKSIEFTVNNTKVDIHYPQYLDLMGRLTIGADKREAYNDMIGELNIVTRFSHNHIVHANQVSNDAPQMMRHVKPKTTIMLPLSFWWCKDYTQALPVGLLLFSDIYVNVEYQDFDKLYIQYEEDISGGPTGPISVSSNTTITKVGLEEAKLYVDYVYMSGYSRERISNKAVFYVIKQVRTPGSVPLSTSSINYRLSFVMPIVSILFGIQEDGAIANDVRRYDWWDRYKGNHSDLANDPLTAWDETILPSQLPDSPITEGTLRILNSDRFSTRNWLYWNRYTSFRTNTRSPSSRGVYVYHFALFPEQHLASGAVNLSRADNNFLYLIFNRGTGADGYTTNCGIGSAGVTGNLHLFGTNHNYLYLQGGYITVLYNV